MNTENPPDLQTVSQDVLTTIEGFKDKINSAEYREVSEKLMKLHSTEKHKKGLYRFTIIIYFDI